jgi:lysozyme family protein
LLAAKPPAETASIAQAEDKVLDFAINIMEERKMSDMDHFVAAFLKAATKSKNGLVGSRTLGALRVKYNINLTAPQMEKEHWIESITQPGKMKIRIAWLLLSYALS